MNTDKFEYTLRVFDSYERRFAKARFDKRFRDAALADVRNDIKKEAQQMLCLDKIPMPNIKIIASKDEEHNGYCVRFMQFGSFKNTYGEANLIFPNTSEKKFPAIIICNGHSTDGRLDEAYQKMAFSFASQGFAVLMSDNLGQGSRKEFGHLDAISPLVGGITLQGMIVRETNAWIEWLAEQPFIDSSRIGACGNSGGGTLTLFLTATNKRLSAVASCGYPSEFSYVHAKEKKHCACNLLRGSAHLADMPEIYSAFAPKPLMLCNGRYDDLFPADLFRKTVRKVRAVYEKMGAGYNFESSITATKHSWEEEDVLVLTDFFCRHLGVPKADMTTPNLMDVGCRFDYPDGAITTNELAEKILGQKIDKALALGDVYPPTFDGKPVEASLLAEELFADDPMRILAQMEFALTK